MDVIGEVLDETFGGRWLPFLTAVAAYLVFVLTLYEKTPTVKNSPKAKNLLDGIRMFGGILVMTAAVILAGRAIFGSFDHGLIGLAVTVGSAIIVGFGLLWAASREPGSVPSGATSPQLEPSDQI